MLVSLQLESSYELLGLYEGVPITERAAVASDCLPNMIRLYRLPILAMRAESGDSVEICVRNVLVHEIGHYFGFSDIQMQEFEQKAEN